MERKMVERTQSFKWNSKMELYAYFAEKYGISREIVDGAVTSVIRIFRPRKHQLIRTQELWEKVGNVLECDYQSLISINNIN